MNKTRKIALALLSVSAAWPGLIAQTTPPPAPAAKDTSDEELVVLTPFEISTSKDTGYQATETLAGTRIRTDLKDVASSISVVTKEFMQDIGATDNASLLQYVTNAEVGGPDGNFAGVGRGVTLSNSTPIVTNQRVRGLVSADQTRDYFTTNVPWDSYNIDRVEIQRGPNSILFGLGSPAGIINASTRNAEFHNLGSVETRAGSYDSYRGSIDLNQQLVNNVLAIRIDGLWDNQKYQQKPAFKEDKRIYGALRWDPKFFGPDFTTSFKAKFENGKITANMPRTGTVYDSVTPWFTDANKVKVDGSAISTYDLGSAPKGYSPWLATISGQQTPTYLMSGTTGETYQINSGYINNAFLSADGTKKLGAGNNAIGQKYSEMLYGVGSYRTYASNVADNVYLGAMANDKMLTDKSVFDFYNNLIDGDNKRETAKWNSFNLSFAQQGWGDRVGIELSYDYQSYHSGNRTLLGDSPTLNVDVTQVLQDGSTNPNYGRPYVTSNNGGTGSSYDIVRKDVRASLFGELRSTDFIHNDLVAKLIGRHRLNVVASQDQYDSENRAWNLYAKDNAWDAYTTQTTGYTTAFDYRGPLAVLYLGKTLSGATTASGANLPAVTQDINLKSGYSYLFDSTWTGGANVANTAWTPTAGTYLANEVYAGSTGLTQASNPANYVGWSSTRYLNLLSAGSGDPLYTSASKVEQIVKSYAGSWQGFMVNEAIVPTVGWRYDTVKQRSVTAGKNGSDKNYLKLDGSDYALPEYNDKSYYKGHSLSGGVVVHLNNLLPKKWDKNIPLNVSVSYNDSKNFQVTSRVDMYGNPITNPEGKTKEFGVMLATKDNRFSLRAIKYETEVTKATVSAGGFDPAGFLGTLQQGLKFRNIFLYQMTGYTWDTRAGFADTTVPLASTGGGTMVYNGQTVTTGLRYFWTPAYVDANGRAVQTAYYQNYNQTLPSTATHLQTWTESLAMRDASMKAWNDIQRYLDSSGFASIWKMTNTTESALTDRTTYEASIKASGNPAANTPADASLLPDPTTVGFVNGAAPAGFALTSDQKSKGEEFEFTANVTSNWRIAFNASKATASQYNIGGNGYQALVDMLDTAIAGAAGEMRQYNGDYQSGNSLRKKYSDWRTTYTWLKLQEDTSNAEIRKWHFNVVTNYSFTKGWLKGFGIGGAYRWMDKAAIGYPVYVDDAGYAQYNVKSPIYGKSEEGVDGWLSYERKLSEKIHWKIQLNIRNALKNEGLLPVTIEPDGTTWAGVQIKPVQEWSVTNTFSF
jgi:outer membrane receptor protein involved in Fe transport